MRRSCCLLVVVGTASPLGHTWTQSLCLWASATSWPATDWDQTGLKQCCCTVVRQLFTRRSKSNKIFLQRFSIQNASVEGGGRIKRDSYKWLHILPVFLLLVFCTALCVAVNKSIFKSSSVVVVVVLRGEVRNSAVFKRDMTLHNHWKCSVKQLNKWKEVYLGS